MSASARPRLLHVFSLFAPGGAELRTVRLIEAFGDELDHTILATSGDLRAALLVPKSAPVRYLPGLQKKKATFPKMVPLLRRVIAQAAPDLVLTYNFGAFDAAVAARTLGLPVIHHEDGFNADEAKGYSKKRVLARRVVLPWLHRTVVPSSTLREIAMRVWRVPEKRVAWIPNGLDRVDRENPVTRADLGIPERVPVIAFVGILRPEKNVPRLFEACERLADTDDFRLLIFGQGPEKKALEERARAPKLRDRVVFLGHQQAPWRFASAIDVFALSSDTEQMPVSILEAMVSAKPVVATDVGDIRSMLPEESRHFVVPPASFADALARLVRDAPLRHWLGRLNEAHVRTHFSLDRMANAHRALYRDALQGRDRRGGARLNAAADPVQQPPLGSMSP